MNMKGVTPDIHALLALIGHEIALIHIKIMQKK